jgi:hypothetical protein
MIDRCIIGGIHSMVKAMGVPIVSAQARSWPRKCYGIAVLFHLIRIRHCLRDFT